MAKTLQQHLTAAQLADAEAFHRAIDEERMRVDRNGAHFALLLFNCDGHCGKRAARMAARFAGRLRATDRIGCFNDRAFGVLLPDTDGDGAAQLADQLTEALPVGDLARSVEIYVYPTDRLPTRPRRGDDDQSDIRPADALFVRPIPRWKRLADIVGACVGLVLCLPLMVAAAAAIKATSKGPVLFTQQRAGLGGQPFTIYKLRTMVADAEARKPCLRWLSEQDGPAFKIKNDPRVTAVGRYLRRTCIDELPQLWNVLRGDMSLVGPRPLPCDEAALCSGWQRRRLSVTPGLTCTWQVSRQRLVPFVEWMRMDIRYVTTRRLLVDLALLWKTMLAVVFHRASH